MMMRYLEMPLHAMPYSGLPASLEYLQARVDGFEPFLGRLVAQYVFLVLTILVPFLKLLSKFSVSRKWIQHNGIVLREEGNVR